MRQLFATRACSEQAFSTLACLKSRQRSHLKQQPTCEPYLDLLVQEYLLIQWHVGELNLIF